MGEILLRIGSEKSYEAIKSFTKELGDVEVLEEITDIFPFSKEDGDKRIALSQQQFLEGKTISIFESRKRTAAILEKYK